MENFIECPIDGRKCEKISCRRLSPDCVDAVTKLGIYGRDLFLTRQLLEKQVKVLSPKDKAELEEIEENFKIMVVTQANSIGVDLKAFVNKIKEELNKGDNPDSSK